MNAVTISPQSTTYTSYNVIENRPCTLECRESTSYEALTIKEKIDFGIGCSVEVWKFGFRSLVYEIYLLSLSSLFSSLLEIRILVDRQQTFNRFGPL
jgi:hypothetical protein